jgi:hypothetical protein
MIRGCEICQHNNPCDIALLIPGTQRWGTYPGEDWQLDFTHLPGGPASRLLVLVDTFTGWVEAFPCSSKKAQEVIKVLISEIILRFRSLRLSKVTMGQHSNPKSLRESLRLWESNIISTVPGDPNPQARLREPMDYSRDTCLSWLRKLTSPGKNYYL